MPLRLPFNSIVENDVWTADKNEWKRERRITILILIPLPLLKDVLELRREEKKFGYEGNASQIRQFSRDICSFREQRECPCFLGIALRESRKDNVSLPYLANETTDAHVRSVTQKPTRSLRT